jgi:hypothetical protein
MPGLRPGIHDWARGKAAIVDGHHGVWEANRWAPRSGGREEIVDGRAKPGHDGEVRG